MRILEVYREGDSDTFESNGVHYRMTPIFAIAATKPIVEFPISKLSWILEYCNSDPNRVYQSDYKVPLIICEIDNQWVTVDGEHRLTKAVIDGLDYLPCRIISSDELDTARI